MEKRVFKKGGRRIDIHASEVYPVEDSGCKNDNKPHYYVVPWELNEIELKKEKEKPKSSGPIAFF